MLNTPSSKVCSLLLMQPFLQNMSPLSSSLESSASSFCLSPFPLRIRHRKPYSLQRERGQSGLKPSWQPFAGPQPHPCPRTAAKGLAAWPWRRARRAWGKGRRTTVEDSIKRRIGSGRRGTEEQSKFREIWGHSRMTVYIKEAYGALSHRGPVLCYSG